MVKWMCGVSLKDRKHSEDMYSLLGIQSVADVVRSGGLRWFGHLKHKCKENWVTEIWRWWDRKTWGEYVSDDLELLGLQPR